EWIRANLCEAVPPVDEEPKPGVPVRWADRRLLIFTEYADTKRYLESALGAHISQVDRNLNRIATFHDVVPFSVEILGAILPSHYAIFFSVTTAASRALMS